MNSAHTNEFGTPAVKPQSGASCTAPNAAPAGASTTALSPTLGTPCAVSMVRPPSRSDSFSNAVRSPVARYTVQSGNERAAGRIAATGSPTSNAT
jgi:hypothetical protein